MIIRNVLFLPLLASAVLVVAILSSATLTYKKDNAHLHPEKLIAKMEDALGGKNRFYSMQDVSFDYTFEYAEAGKKDLSEERMIFDGEHSWAKYMTHEAIVFPDQKGEVIHAYVQGKPYVTLDGKTVKEEKALKSCEGIRKANYYWFTMMYKLSDPGVRLTSMGHERVGDKLYHKVMVEYDVEVVGKTDNDSYLLYINSKTHLVDRFHFGIPEDGSHQGVKIMVDYETVDGLKLPAKRSAYMPDEQGKYSDQPRLIQTSSNFTFKNGFKVADLIP